MANRRDAGRMQGLNAISSHSGGQTSATDVLQKAKILRSVIFVDSLIDALRPQ